MDDRKSMLREVFTEAAEIADPAARNAFLDSACDGDKTLRIKVERLLNAESRAGNFLRDRGDTTTFGLSLEKPGERIGRYRLIEQIGRGGGGVVYLAEQEEPVRRRVALKIIKLGMDTQSVVARFEAERQALAMMDHPNIARVFDAGATDKGRPYFVMELVSGLRITDYCDRHQLSVQQRLELFIPVCHAVQHAHQKGIIHRDLKPSNILVTEHEGVAVPKVIDFGIAKATQQDVDDRAGLTSEDQFLGTPAYMSPEQVEYGGRDVDTRSDIYSLGVILYELLAGRPPFDPKALARAGVDEMRRIIRDVDPPRPSTTLMKRGDPAGLASSGKFSRERLSAVRGDLDWIVTKCLEKDRSGRYETPSALAMDIRRHLEHESVVARPPSTLYRLQKVVRRHRLAFIAGGSILLVLIAAVIVSSGLAFRATRAEFAQSRLRDLAETRAAETQQQLIRRYVAEGNRLAGENRVLLALPWMVEALRLETGDSQREADERIRIAQTLVAAPELRIQYTQGSLVNCVALSPDGARVVSGSDDGIVRITDLGKETGASTNLSIGGSVGCVAFSPDGTRVLAATMAGVARVWNSRNGEALTPLLRAADFEPGSVAGTPRTLNPAASFSPDGKLLLLGWGSKSAQLRDAGTGELVRELPHGGIVYHAAFSADGRWAATSGKDGIARVWDVATGAPAGPALKHTGYVGWSQFSSDGNKLMTVRERHGVQLWDWRKGIRLAPEIVRRSELFHYSLSPDGTNVLTTARSGYAHIYDAETSRLTSQFHQQGGLIDASFSPDGGHIATACEDGNAWIWDAAEWTARPVVLPQGNHIQRIAYSRNGRLLAVGGAAGRVRVWDLYPAERGVCRFPGNDVQWTDFDSTGARALVLSTGSNRSLGVYDVQSAALISSVNLTADEIRARLSPDGHRAAAFGRSPNVRIFDADSGKLLRRLTHRRVVRDALWGAGGKLLFTATQTGVYAWDVASGKVLRSYTNSGSVREMAISPDGYRLAVAGQDNTLAVIDTSTAQPLGKSAALRGSIHHLRFSTDSKRLAIAIQLPGGEGLLEVREAASGELLGKPIVQRDKVDSVDFSQNGFVATGCDDHTACVWDPVSGEAVTPFLPHEYECEQVCFSRDGSRLATRERRGVVRVWSARTGEPITRPIVYSRKSGDGCLSYSPDGMRLLIARGGNEAWLRELQPETASLDELTSLAQVLSCTRFDPAAGMVPLDETSLNNAWQKLNAIRNKH
jgi:WD40 repeat protein/serine/threonine protein kinase